MSEHERDLSLNLDEQKKIKQPYLYQSECLSELAKVRNSGKRKALVVMATGTGKTAVSAFDVKDVIKDIESPRVLYLCHQSEILSRAQETFAEVLGDSYSYGFFEGRRKSDIESTNVLFATFQTLSRNISKFDPNFFDYVVVDESHHSHAETYRPVVNYFNPKFMLGITATPDRADLLDIREMFGREVYSLPLERAIALSLLAKIDYRVMSANISREVVDKLNKISDSKLTIPLLDKELFQPLVLQEVVDRIKEKISKTPNPRVMIFTSSIDKSEVVANMMESAVALHSRIKVDRNKIIGDFKNGDLNVVTVIDMFNEGIDIPQTNVIVFLRSTTSKAIYLQQLGRGLRKVAGKESVLVLDFVGNCERIQMIGEFWNKIQDEIVKQGRGIEGDRFNDREANIGKIDFSEVALDILDIIGRASQNENSRSSENLISEMKDLARRLGKTPTKRDIDKFAAEGLCVSSSTYIRRFESFNNAIEAAGLVINLEFDEQRSDEDLINDLRMARQFFGKTPTKRDIDQLSKDGLSVNSTTYVRRFASFNKALAKAGLVSNHEVLPVKLEDQLLKELSELSIKLGRIPTKRDVNVFSSQGVVSHSATYIRRFGSYKKALAAAGLIDE